MGGGGVDDDAGKDGADERRGFPHDAEKGEEEEFLAARGDFGDLEFCCYKGGNECVSVSGWVD